MTNKGNNDFLTALLSLQQDGKEAISAPTNWTTHEPLLDIATEIDDVIEELSRSIIKGNDDNRVARWHIIIGSPGNGKSAAMGRLCRILQNDLGCRVLDEEGTPIQDLEPTAIPYVLEVFEGNNNYVSARIIQDASVVRKPFSPNPDPAAEMLSSLDEAWEKGISLLICTNRGVLEKAYSDNHTDRTVNTTAWFKILADIVSSETTIRGVIEREWSFTGRKPVFDRLQVSYSYLDNYSLFIGRDVFDRLVLKATDMSRWTVCEGCIERNLCPFKANRDWLANPEARGKVLSILQRAEAFSGQIIVFREALAIISLILSGCPRDYQDIHPCEWVRLRASSGDVFSLAMRRIYMLLFASYSPFAMEPSRGFYEKQVSSLRKLNGFVPEDHVTVKAALNGVLNGLSPSTDVGINRLLGEQGILADIDSWGEFYPLEFQDTWDTDYDVIRSMDSPFVTDIEYRCLEVWSFLEQLIESISGYQVHEFHWALKRWSSNFLIHLGALVEGLTAWSSELDEYLKLIEILFHDPDSRTIDEKRAIRELDFKLETLLNNIGCDTDQSGSIQLSEFVNLIGPWVEEKMKPSTVVSEKSTGLSLKIQFEGGERAMLAAPTFLWLYRSARGRLMAQCYPSELLTGILDARVRAASKGKYAFADDDVELKVDSGEGFGFRITRIDGDVDVTNE